VVGYMFKIKGRLQQEGGTEEKGFRKRPQGKGSKESVGGACCTEERQACCAVKRAPTKPGVGQRGGKVRGRKDSQRRGSPRKKGIIKEGGRLRGSNHR